MDWMCLSTTWSVSWLIVSLVLSEWKKKNKEFYTLGDHFQRLNQDFQALMGSYVSFTRCCWFQISKFIGKRRTTIHLIHEGRRYHESETKVRSILDIRFFLFFFPSQIIL